MITLRKSEARRHIKSAHQDTWLTFDPESQVDPMRHGFHGLESLNEEHPGPEMGLLRHRPGDLEVITYVHEGTLIHQARMGELDRIQAGEFQHTRAGRGVVHRSINASLTGVANIFQSCLTLDRPDLDPRQQRKSFTPAEREGVLRIVASPDGSEDSLRIHPDIRMYSSLLQLGHHLIHKLGQGRGAWLQVVKGRIQLGDHSLVAGDGAALDHEAAVSIKAQLKSEILLFDLA